MAKNSKKQIQTKNGFPILVEKKPKPKIQNKQEDGKLYIDPLKVYETIGKSVSDYRLDKVTKEMTDLVGKGKHQFVYNDDRNSSMHIVHAIQVEQAVKKGTLVIPNETSLYDQNSAGKITDQAKKYLKNKVIPKYERSSKAKCIDGKTLCSPGIKLPHYGLGMLVKDNSNYGLFAKLPDQVDDLIKEIKSRKDFEDLFGPLKKVRVQQFRDYLGKCFPSYDTTKVGTKIIATLKNYAYLKSLKGNDRKFIPDAEEITIILIVSYIYDVAKYIDQAPYTVLNTLNTYVFKASRNGSNLEALKIIEHIEAIINILEYENLDSGVMDEFHHYDIKIKFLRLLSEPRLDTLMETILKELDGKMKFGYVDGKSDYDASMFYINMIKKLGLRYISSRSNIEWMFYGSTLKKIRNFMSKDMYRAFVKVILQNLEAYKLKEYNGVEFTTGSNLWYLERTIKVIVELREKKYNKIKK